MELSKLRELARLTEAQRTRDLAALEAAMAEDRRLEDIIANTAKVLSGDFRHDAAALMPMRQFSLREAWVEQTIRQAKQARAELAPRIEQLRQIAAQSLGKHEALGKITARLHNQEVERAQSRFETDAPPDLSDSA